MNNYNDFLEKKEIIDKPSGFERDGYMIETAFVTPHAVRQFQKRIHALAYDDALTAILVGLKMDSVTPKCSQNKISDYVRVWGRKNARYDFRAVIKCDESGLPVVVTILRSGKTKASKAGQRIRAKQRKKDLNDAGLHTVLET